MSGSGQLRRTHCEQMSSGLPLKRTFLDTVGMSQTCQQATSHMLAGQTNGRPWAALKFKLERLKFGQDRSEVHSLPT
jgi:hypothetical protein